MLDKIPGSRGNFSIEHRDLYMRWYTMVRRCHDPKDKNYDKYGARGIVVCEQWRNDPLRFYSDMGFPLPGMSVERDDNNGDYRPGNCRWATAMEQANNRRSSVKLLVNGVLMTVANAARATGIKATTMYSRIGRGINPLTGEK